MTVYGWDMSHYDSPGIGSAVKDGISFITHKAGGDSSSGDAELDNWWSGVKGLPESVVLGAYWVPRPDLYPGAAGQADRFIDTLDSRCPGWRDREAFILQVDAEIWNGDSATKPNASYLRTFCDRLVSRTAGTYRPIIYASQGQYGNSLAGIGYPLWNARYPYDVQESFKAAYARAGGDSGKGWGSYSGQTPAIWQYTSSATIGGQTTSDANAFRGTVDQLKELVTPMALTQADKDWISAQIETIADKVWQTKIGNANYPNRTAIRALNDLSTQRDAEVDPNVTLDEANIQPGVPLARIIAAADKILEPPATA